MIVEIGPGRGALTEKLLERAARVVAIEVDPEMVAHLEQKFAGNSRLEIVPADVLQTDLAQWGSVPIAGNLPYYIASPIMEKVARLAAPRAVFLIQKEVAERLVAAPGTREYGYLTVQIAVFAAVRYLFAVKPGAFRPPPQVDSAVVLLEPRAEGPAVEDPEGFLRFVGHCFAHKRKTLRNNLAPIYGNEVVAGWPESTRRAEQLPLATFVDLWGRIKRGQTECFPVSDPA